MAGTKPSFPGTRGEIDARTALHRMHSCLLVDRRVLVDCGADWLGKVERLDPELILLTHAHPDHAAGLKRGAACPVYGTSETWEKLRRYAIGDRRTIQPREPFVLSGVTFEAFTVEHSLIAPAVGFRINGVGRRNSTGCPCGGSLARAWPVSSRNLTQRDNSPSA